MQKAKNLIGPMLIVILTISAVFNPFTTRYIQELKGIALSVSAGRDALYREIEQKAEEYETPPEDAKIDRVWKLMPGYNGLKVDVPASYKRMKKDKRFDERKLVFTQLPPKVHLEDLGPAPIFRGHPEKPMVSFLINVAWGNEYIPPMLATLEKHQVHATFFLEGRWVKENPALAKVIADAGHEIGNHSYTHPLMEKLSAEKTREEIMKTNEVIEAITGKKAVWFGPPAGSYRQETVEIASSLGLKTVMWTVDTIDWKKPSPAELQNRVLKKVHPGAMILMHPTDPAAKSLETLILELKKRELKIGPVSKLMEEERMIK